MAGATPNDTMSERLSSCAPNSEVVPVMRAIRPSSMSKITATTINWTAVSNSSHSE